MTEGSIGPIYTALKILYTKILHRIWDVNRIPRIKERRRLPVVLSPQEIKAIFDTTENIEHKAILMTIYSGGLRVSEVCNLKVSDIDSKNIQIFIRQGKGKKKQVHFIIKIKSRNSQKILGLLNVQLYTACVTVLRLNSWMQALTFATFRDF